MAYGKMIGYEMGRIVIFEKGKIMFKVLYKTRFFHCMIRSTPICRARTDCEGCVLQKVRRGINSQFWEGKDFETGTTIKYGTVILEGEEEG